MRANHVKERVQNHTAGCNKGRPPPGLVCRSWRTTEPGEADGSLRKVRIFSPSGHTVGHCDLFLDNTTPDYPSADEFAVQEAALAYSRCQEWKVKGGDIWRETLHATIYVLNTPRTSALHGREGLVLGACKAGVTSSLFYWDIAANKDFPFS